jgi:hypothetical protein
VRRKKYLKGGAVVLCMLGAAVICVVIVIFLMYNSGLRYMRTASGMRYFGRVGADGYISHGRMWHEDSVASISAQRFYIVEINGAELLAGLDFRSYPGFDSGFNVFDILDTINENIPEHIRRGFDLGHFIFSRESAPVVLRRETFADLIRSYERGRNNIISGEIIAEGGKRWVLHSSSASPSSFRDFEIADSSDRTNLYRGDLLGFIENEGQSIIFASFGLAGGGFINLYPARDVYRIDFERGGSEGNLFIGEVNGDLQRHGKGLYFFENTGDIYFGDFAYGEKTGEAAILFSHGGSYAGQVMGGMKSGEGVFSWADGSSYSGGFLNNMKNGRGRYYFDNGSIYEGDWVDGVREGQGIFWFLSGDMYEGEFANDLFSGHGRYTWASGEVYEGSFVNNAIHGWGKFEWLTGRTYEGWFSIGEMTVEPPEGFG